MAKKQDGHKVRRTLPDALRLDPSTMDADPFEVAAYLAVRARREGYRTRKSVNLNRGDFALVRQSDEEARVQVNVAARTFEREFEMRPGALRQWEREHPQIVAAADAAVAFIVNG